MAQSIFTKEKNMKIAITLTVIFILVMLLHSFAMATSITLRVPEKYSEVKAGERIYFETDIKIPENPERKDLRIEYYIEDEQGIEIAYSKVLKAVETQASFMESLNIPESTKEGNFKIYANISDYNGNSQEVVASFKVINDNPITSNNYLFIILGLITLIAIIILIELSILLRKRM